MKDRTKPWVLARERRRHEARIKRMAAMGRSGRLANRDACIMAARQEGRTLADIGREFGLQKERVRQICLRIDRKRKHTLRVLKEVVILLARTDRLHTQP